MDNIEAMRDEVNSIEGQLNDVIDEMIERYGKFLTLSDVDNRDNYKRALVADYNYLMKRKEYLVNQIHQAY